MNGEESKLHIYRTYKKNKLKIWISFLVAAPAVLILGSLFFPDLFWERFLWRYIWGPVVADAEGRVIEGVSAGYNPVNTIVYAIVLIISFFGIYEIFEYFEIEVDQRFVYSLMPWVILGGSLRSLEDVGLFKEPLDRFMITPLIYFLLGFFVLLILLVGATISRSDPTEKRSDVLKLVLLLPIPFLYLTIHNFLVDFFVWLFIIIILGILFSFFLGRKFFDMDEKYFFFSYGLVFLFITISYNVYYSLSRPDARFFEVILIPALSVAVTLLLLGCMWLIDRFTKKKSSLRWFSLFGLPLNLLIAWAHLFDASATYRGIIAYGYAEKHVLPNILIEVTGTPLIMFPVKLVLIFSIIYILDIALKKDFSDKKRLVVFLKFLIIVLGAAPGVRNTLRIAMGV